MKLMIERVDVDSLVVEHATNETGLKFWKITGPFMQAEIQNRNGRIYKLPTLRREVDKFVNEKVKTNRALGELDHPPTPQVTLDRVSHKITDLQIVENDIVGTATILNTPTGRIAQALLEGGVKLGVSSRGLGDLEEDKKTVSDNFNLVTIDIVGDPSALNAYVDGIYESKEFIVSGDSIVEKAVKDFTNQLDKHGTREIMQDLKRFLESIK